MLSQSVSQSVLGAGSVLLGVSTLGLSQDMSRLAGCVMNAETTSGVFTEQSPTLSFNCRSRTVRDTGHPQPTEKYSTYQHV